MVVHCVPLGDELQLAVRLLAYLEHLPKLFYPRADPLTPSLLRPNGPAQIVSRRNTSLLGLTVGRRSRPSRTAGALETANARAKEESLRRPPRLPPVAEVRPKGAPEAPANADREYLDDTAAATLHPVCSEKERYVPSSATHPSKTRRFVAGLNMCRKAGQLPTLPKVCRSRRAETRQ